MYPHISNNDINIVHLLSQSHHPSAGAVVLFSGEARNSNKGKEVIGLEYEAHDSMANKMIEEILSEAKTKWNLEIAICVHRIGKVGISECAVCVITSSKHRKEAYEANQYIIHKVKHEAPIWKKELFTDGTYSWGNNCNCTTDHHTELVFHGH
ncbi:MAG: molybdenum cofactor biosynthesis protein MoaE [Bacteroidota bacterium]|nr:molybdenum cofactor biosynthesis protein MoaE [Bacteroidota bacterium]